MQSKQSIIRWTEVTSDTFTYGSHLKIKDDETVFENPLMPSGEMIHCWKMMTYYPSDKTIPQLPILRQGKTYHFYFDYEVFPKGGVYFKIVFKRRNGTELDVVMVEGQHAKITYPLDAFSYEIQMMNAAATHVTFRSIKIAASRHVAQINEKLYISEMIQIQDDTDVVNIVLITQEGIVRDDMSALHNVILIEHWRIADLEKIVDCLQPLERGYDLNFIGYNELSNHMAYLLAECMGQRAWISHDVQLERQPYVAVEIYSSDMHEIRDLSLIVPLLQPSRHLENLDVNRLNGGV